MFDRYRTDPPPHLETSTRKIQEIHFRRILEVFPSTDLRSFDRATAQGYVGRRSKQNYRGQAIQRQTIEKELKTFRRAWVSGRSPEIPPPTFAVKDLSFPKAMEKPPFMSWSQIEREIARGGRTV